MGCSVLATVKATQLFRQGQSCRRLPAHPSTADRLPCKHTCRPWPRRLGGQGWPTARGGHSSISSTAVSPAAQAAVAICWQPSMWRTVLQLKRPSVRFPQSRGEQ